MSHALRSPLRTGVARALRYAPRSARAEFGRVTARRVRRATQKALSRVAAGVDVEGVAWPTRREHGASVRGMAKTPNSAKVYRFLW